MNKAKLKFLLEKVLPYVEGAYECAFPDEDENSYVAEEVRKVIAELSSEDEES